MIETKTTCEQNVDACFQLFIREGLRAVSIDDIVRNCSLSKKELYENFGNKEGVIREVFRYDLDVTERLFETAQATSDHAIGEMVQVHQHFMKRLSNVSPVLFFDLRKYYVEIEQEHFNGKMAMSKQFVLNNMERGIKENIYRRDIDKEVVSTLWVSKMEIVREQKLFPLHKFDIQRLIHQFTELHLRSIVNPKGLEIINQFYQKKSTI